jgi:LuxR family maltose regulon positive regulatory protein
MMLAEAYLLAGDADLATAWFLEAVALDALSDNRVISEAELALLGMDGGRWAEASDHVKRALDMIDQARMHDYATSVLAFAVAARLAVHRGDLNEATARLTQAMRARPSCTAAVPWLAVRSRLQLAKVYWSMGDQATARHLLREIDDILLRRPALGALVDEVAQLRHIVSSARRAGAAGASPLTPAELRLLPYLQTHLTIREIAERTFVSRNTVSSQVSGIYRKLGVSSRTDAVEQATAVGLLGG